MIKIHKLSKIYQSGVFTTTALKEINLEIEKGEFVAIMGPSGSGKSTLMHILGGLDNPSSGAYFLDNKDIAKFSDDELSEIRNKKIGFVFQAFNLLPRTSAIKNVSLPLSYTGISKKERMEKAGEALETVGLQGKNENRPNQLSGGQIQRVAIARALINNPALILADEPTGNLDTKAGNEIMEIFQKLNEKGHTIILVTHEKEIAEYAKRVILLRDGEVVEDRNNQNQRIIIRK